MRCLIRRLLPTLVSALALAGSAVSAAAAERLQIAVVPKGSTHAFWKSMEAGVRKAASEEDVTIIWKGPMKEDDRAQQISVVQQFVASKVSAIVLAPLDATALVGPVRSAAAAKIPVVIIDSALRADVGRDFVSLVATDNFRGGEMGGEELARRLGGKGKVVLLRCLEGSASTEEREAGFLAAIARHPGIEVTVKNRYGGATVSLAQDAALNLIDRLREADGIFCPNESTTQGMLLALRQTGLAGKKTFVGFDTSPALLQALRRGDIQGLVAQNPSRMGYLGVKTAVAHLRGQKVDPRIDTGCALVTLETIDTPETKAVLATP